MHYGFWYIDLIHIRLFNPANLFDQAHARARAHRTQDFYCTLINSHSPSAPLDGNMAIVVVYGGEKLFSNFKFSEHSFCLATLSVYVCVCLIPLCTSCATYAIIHNFSSIHICMLCLWHLFHSSCFFSCSVRRRYRFLLICFCPAVQRQINYHRHFVLQWERKKTSWKNVVCWIQMKKMFAFLEPDTME